MFFKAHIIRSQDPSKALFMKYFLLLLIALPIKSIPGNQDKEPGSVESDYEEESLVVDDVQEVFSLQTKSF